MGSSESKTPAPEPQDPLLESPWRVTNWTTKDELLNYVRTYTPEGASHLRILVYGSVGVGKSSFINTVGSVITGRKVIVAAANVSNSATSFTRKFKTHQFRFKESENRTVPVVFNDVIGLEATGPSWESHGVQHEDIKLAMKGHVREGYTFNPSHALTRDNLYFNPSPTIDDKVHVLVCMLKANASGINPSVLEKMKEIREMARDLGIPQVAVATHIDVACKETNTNIRNVYRSQHLKDKIELFSRTVGIPISQIYAVRNHYEGPDKHAADTLVLTVLKDMLDFGDDCIKDNN